MRLFLQDHPQGVHDAGQPAEEREEDVQPEVQPEAHLQEDAKRRQEEGKKNANDVQDEPPEVVNLAGQRPPLAMVSGL